VAYSPKDRRAWRGLGFALLAQGQDEEAIAAWQAVGRQMADESIRWGKKAQQAGQIEEALTWYKRAVLLAPDWGMPWYYLGRLYEDLGKWDDAIESFRKAEEYIDSIAEISGSLYFRLGRRLKAHKEPPDSATLLRYYEAALASDNFVLSWERLDAHIHRGDILYRQGRVQEALREYKWLVDTEPSYYWGHARLGRAIWEVSGDIDEAEKHLKQAIVLRPKEKWAYLRLGHIYREAGRQIDATYAYHRVLIIDPQDKTALQFFAAEHQGDVSQPPPR
jgi:tetratricopeptide (TPR) repeat protein